MLKNFSTKAKLMSLPIVFVLIVIVSGVIYTYYNGLVTSRISSATQTEIFIQQVLKGRIAVYQFLRSPSEKTVQNVLDSFDLLDKNVSALKSKLSLAENVKICDEILEESANYIKYFNQFSKKRIDEVANGISKESDALKPIISNMVKSGESLEESLQKINKSALSLKEDAEISLQYTLLAIAIVSNLLFLVFSTVLTNIILSSLEKFKVGLSSFFAYINRETEETSLLEIDGNDEFALMAKEVNENINKTKNRLMKDNDTVKEVLSIVEKANEGYLDLQVKNQANNPQLVQLCKALNSMLSGFRTHIDSVNKVLNEFSNYKFTSKVDERNIHGDMATLIKSVNFLTDEVSTLLKNSYIIGLTLDEASDQLIINVDTLNTSSNEAAASLEETAAALEEITSTIVNNADNVQSMSDYAVILSESAKKGQTLAQNTSGAMEDITAQVNSISEAIIVIDQIAFQTNILSLNAAVEAATAGEAGKGFAVVAQEVRNLAARSAEAAKEIKSIVENATSKASHGKEISNEMIKGYDELLVNISKSTEKISEIAGASKEQEQGITQINDAVTQLDQQTQKNAQIAAYTHDIAVETDTIAKEIVKDAQEKEFLGKNSAHARKHDKSSNITSKKVENKVQSVDKKVSKVETKKVIKSENHNEDEWESF
ncbi:MAG: chemotaxis protein [Arcobacter sp.]|nr:MAG: chemotaxis protein [Arcobacter sp.]